MSADSIESLSRKDGIFVYFVISAALTPLQ